MGRNPSGRSGSGTVDGSKTVTCNDCGEVIETEVIPATGHNWVAGTVVEPTCTTEGYTNYACACGATKTDDSVEPTGHDYSAVVTDPTHTTAGYTTYTCDCGDTYVGDETAALGHNYVNGVCSCGDVKVVEVPGDIIIEGNEDLVNEIIEEIKENGALAGFVPENLPENGSLEISVSKISASDDALVELVFVVSPKDENGNKVSTFEEGQGRCDLYERHEGRCFRRDRHPV